MTVIEERAADVQSGRVTLSRTDSTDVRQRQIYARLDDGPSHSLVFGKTVTLDVPAGDHVLHANNTLFWKRIAFFVAPGQHIEFSLINRSGLLGFGFLALLGVAPLTLTIERRPVATLAND
jgi:hypothetical protein